MRTKSPLSFLFCLCFLVLLPFSTELFSYILCLIWVLSVGSEHRLSCRVHSGFSGRNWIPGRERWKTGREGPEFWRLGPQSVLQDVPGRPPPTHPDLNGQVGVLGSCGREGTRSPEPAVLALGIGTSQSPPCISGAFLEISPELAWPKPPGSWQRRSDLTRGRRAEAAMAADPGSRLRHPSLSQAEAQGLHLQDQRAAAPPPTC